MSTTKKLAPYAGVKRVDENGRTVLSKLWNMGQPRFEGAMEFDGVDDFVEIEDIYKLKSDEDWTVGFWCYPKEIINDSGDIIGNMRNGSNRWAFWQRSTERIDFELNGNNILRENIRLDGFITGNYYYVVGTYSSSKTFNLYLYDINGNLINSGSENYTDDGDFDSTVESINIGKRLSDSTRYFHGEIFNVSIIKNKALTQQEIKDTMYRRLSGNEDGLVAYYPLDENNRIAKDLTSNHNDGEIIGDPQGVVVKDDFPADSGIYGAMEFDGDGDYIEIDHLSVYNFSNELTVSGLMYSREDKSSYIFSKFDGNTEGFGFRTVSNQRLEIWLAGGEGSVNTPNNIFELDTFYIATVTLSNDEIKFYLNGELAHSVTNISHNLNTNIKGSIGRRNTNNDQYWNGFLGNISVWNKALTEQEINDNMNKRLNGNENGLVAYYPLDERVPRDKSSNGNHGTAVGSPVSVSPFNPIWEGSDRPEFTDYNGFKSVDVEKESENLVPYSDDFNNSYWVKEGVSVVLSDIESPVQEVYELNEDNIEGRHRISQSTDSRNGVYIYSIFLKAKERQYIQLTHVSSSLYQDNPRYANFDLINGEVTFESNNTRARVTPYASGWYRCSFEYDVDDIPTGRAFAVIITAGDSPRFETYQGDEGSGVYIAGAQDEQGSYPTNYIPTEGSTVTRLAPNTVIENALPETGTVAGVVDLVRDISINNHHFIYERASGGGRSALHFNTTANTYTVRVFGETMSNDIPFDFPDWTRKTLAYILTYSENEIVFFWLTSDGSIYKESTSYTTSDREVQDIGLGTDNSGDRQGSVRFEKTHWNDPVVRVNATDQEIKEFFEQLTAGTSMATKAENMTIV